MPISLAEALNKKYNSDSTDDDVDQDTGTTKSGCEFVIFAPRTGFHQCVPNTLIVASSEINTAGDPSTLQTFLGNANELDISGNEFSDLNEIGTVVHTAPKLKVLNLSFNDLSSTQIPKSIEFPNADSLHSLILVGTKATWPVVWYLLSHARNVENLHLSLNEYDAIDLDGCICNGNDAIRADSVDQNSILNTHDIFENVKTVMFDENPISSWAEVEKLGGIFPNLHFLSLTSCSLQNLPSNAHERFHSLKTLWMSNSLLADISDVEKLKYFPSLKDLRLNGMPYLKDFPEEKRRQHIISILPNIQTLNRGKVITLDERETAERNFIRHYKHQEDKPARFHELVQKHGEVHDLVKVNLKPPKTVKLLIRHNEKEIARMDVDLKLSVTGLKELLEPIVGMHASKMQLYYYDVEGCNQDVMKYPDKKLFTYNMQDNDEIIIIDYKSTK